MSISLGMGGALTHWDRVFDNEIWRLRRQDWLNCGSNSGFCSKTKSSVRLMYWRNVPSHPSSLDTWPRRIKLASFLKKNLYFPNSNFWSLMFWILASCIPGHKSRGREARSAGNRSFIILDASFRPPAELSVIPASSNGSPAPGHVTSIDQSGARKPLTSDDTTHSRGKLIICPYLLLKPISENVDYFCLTLNIWERPVVCPLPQSPGRGIWGISWAII